MPASLGSLLIDIGANVAHLRRDMGEANRIVNTGMQSIQRSVATVRRSLFALGAAAGVGISVRDIVQAADSYRLLDARLRLVTGSAQDFQRAQQGLFAIAQETRQRLEGTVDIYARIARATSSLGVGQDQLLQVSRAIGQAVALSATSADAANAALMQLGQGLAAGALRGEELNSVMEQTPRLAQAIAEGMGVGVGSLRALATQGKITAKVILDALSGQADVLEREFAQLPTTVGGALTQVRNAFLRYIGEADTASGATSTMAASIGLLARNFEVAANTVVVAVTALSAAMLGRGVAAASAYVAGVVSAARADAAATASKLASLAAIREHAAMLVADAEAAVANAAGMARLAAVEQTLIPAKARLAAATTAYTAALAASGVAAGRMAGTVALVRNGLNLLGGPIGAVTTALTLGATAWAIWGQRAKSAVDEARARIKDTDSLLRDIEQRRKFGVGQLGQVRADLAQAEKDLEGTLSGRFVRPSLSTPGMQALVAKQRENIEKLRQAVRALEAEERRAMQGPPAPKGDRSGFDAIIAKYRTQKEQLEDAIRELNEKAKLGDVSEAERLAAIERIRAAYANRGGGGARGDARQDVQARLALLRDGLEREQRLIDEAMEDNVVSFQAYYARRLAITQQGIAAEIAAKRAELSASADTGERAKLTADIDILRRQYDETAARLQREQRQALEGVRREADAVQAAFLRANGAEVQAGLIEIAEQYREVEARVRQTGDAALIAAVQQAKAADIARNAIEGEIAALDRQARGATLIRELRESQQPLRGVMNRPLDAGAYESRIARLNDIDAERVRLLREQQDTLGRLMDTEGVTAAQRLRLADEIIAKQIEVNHVLAGSFGEMTEFARQAARNMQDAFGEFFFSLMQGELDGLAANFKRTIDRMVSDLLASQLLKMLTGDFGTTGNLTGLIGKLVGAFAGAGGGGGSAASALGTDLLRVNLPGRASGGDVQPHRAYWVGERGPEVVIPKVASTVVPNDRLGQKTVNVAVYVNGVRDEGGLRKSAQQVALESGRATSRAMARSG